MRSGIVIVALLASSCGRVENPPVGSTPEISYSPSDEVIKVEHSGGLAMYKYRGTLMGNGTLTIIDSWTPDRVVMLSPSQVHGLVQLASAPELRSATASKEVLRPQLYVDVPLTAVSINLRERHGLTWRRVSYHFVTTHIGLSHTIARGGRPAAVALARLIDELHRAGDASLVPTRRSAIQNDDLTAIEATPNPSLQRTTPR